MVGAFKLMVAVAVSLMASEFSDRVPVPTGELTQVRLISGADRSISWVAAIPMPPEGGSMVAPEVKSWIVGAMTEAPLDPAEMRLTLEASTEKVGAPRNMVPEAVILSWLVLAIATSPPLRAKELLAVSVIVSALRFKVLGVPAGAPLAARSIAAEVRVRLVLAVSVIMGAVKSNSLTADRLMLMVANSVILSAVSAKVLEPPGKLMLVRLETGPAKVRTLAPLDRLLWIVTPLTPVAVSVILSAVMEKAPAVELRLMIGAVRSISVVAVSVMVSALRFRMLEPGAAPLLVILMRGANKSIA